jgi:hypothetical protein
MLRLRLRFLRSAVLCAGYSLLSIAGAQTTAAYTTTGSYNSTPHGTAVTVTALSTSAVASTGPDFTTTPFSTYFGSSIDPSFSNVQGQLTADLNGDGAPDLLVYGVVDIGATSNPIRVQSFLSNVKGGFTAGTPQQLTLPAPTSANESVTLTTPLAIDVNADGKLDLLIGTAVAYGNGDGSFQQPVTPAFLSSGFSGTYVADVTGDGKLDIIAVNAIPLASLGEDANIPLDVTVFANQGSGNFQSLGAFTLGTGQYSGSVTLASLNFVDLSGDGKLDLVAQMYFISLGNAEAPATITTLLNNGDGTFATALPVSYTPLPNGGTPELLSLQAADFNGDGKVDLALIYPPPDQTTLTYLSPAIFLPGKGDGSFGAGINSMINTTEQAGAPSAQPPAGNALVTDVNLDGAVDLVFGSGAVALGDGKGNFSAGTPVVEVPIPNGSGAFNYLNIASLGTIQSAQSTYPSLVFASAAGSAPFPLVAIPNSSALTVQGNGGNPTITVTSGQSASIPLSVMGAASYAGSVTLTCTGLPSNASCAFNPATLNLAGGTAQSSTLTVSTSGVNNARTVRPTLAPGMTTLSCGIFAGGLLLLWPKRLRACLMITALAALTLLPMGCGGNSSSSTSKSGNTPAGSYAFQVAATAGTTQTTTNCTLIVQ